MQDMKEELNPFPNNKFQTLPDFSKREEFADDNFKFDENGRKLTKWVEYTVGKRRNCSLRAISPFPTVFSKDLNCRHKNKDLIRKGLNKKFCQIFAIILVVQLKSTVEQGGTGQHPPA